MPQKVKPAPVKHCAICGVLMERKRFGGRLEDYGVFLRRTRCGQVCANSRLEVLDGSNRWRARRFKAGNCTECGTDQKLHVHHIDRNVANNDPSNLTTLCASHHLKLHWREDRPERLAAVRRGALTRQQSTAGNK